LSILRRQQTRRQNPPSDAPSCIHDYLRIITFGPGGWGLGARAALQIDIGPVQPRVPSPEPPIPASALLSDSAVR
jgi:hypothetical protein